MGGSQSIEDTWEYFDNTLSGSNINEVILNEFKKVYLKLKKLEKENLERIKDDNILKGRQNYERERINILVEAKNKIIKKLEENTKKFNNLQSELNKLTWKVNSQKSITSNNNKELLTELDKTKKQISVIKKEIRNSKTKIQPWHWRWQSWPRYWKNDYANRKIIIRISTQCSSCLWRYKFHSGRCDFREQIKHTNSTY